jgi:hypothetical protein
VSTSKTGKHGHAKCHFVAIDIFTGKKYEDLTPSSHNCDVSPLHLQISGYIGVKACKGGLQLRRFIKIQGLTCYYPVFSF